MNTKKRTIIIICLIVALYAASKFRIAEAGDKHILILHIGESASWTTYPVTIHTDCGDIHLKPFTVIGYSGGISGNIYSIYNKRRDIKHNLVYMGNPLNQDIASIDLNGTEIDGLGFFDDNPQSFLLDRFIFSIDSFDTDYVDNNVWYVILDFNEIILLDGTIITPGYTFSTSILKQKNNQWEFYHKSRVSYFIMEIPETEEVKKINSIIFEPNWGKLISYNETTEDEWD